MNNPFINYAQRSYLTIKTSIIDKIKSPIIGIPEITDYSEGNDFIKQVGIWSGISEQLGYYLNKKARERFLMTCRKYESMVSHARSHDYRIHGVNASTGTVLFTASEPATEAIIIPSGTKLKTNLDIEFLTLAEAVIAIGETEVEVEVKQWTLVPEFTWGQSSGDKNQKITLDTNVVDKSMTVKVAGVDIFISVDTFAFSKPESKVYVPGLNEDKKMVIAFGDDITGEIPQSAADIDISYYTSLGAEGNVPANSITEIVDTLTLPQGITMEVTNETNTNGGADVESLEELRVNIPLSIRTKMRAVTDQDYIDIATLAPGVAKADVNYDPNIGVTTYIVPVGGGIASSVLLSQVELFFEDKRSVQTIILAQSVGEVRLQLESVVNVQTGYSQQETINLVKDNLLEFLSWQNADIGGRLVLGDLYQVMESTEGVLNSQILDTDIIPYASPKSNDTIQLNWVIDVVSSGNTVSTYTIQFTDPTTYNLFKDNGFIGSFVVDVEVVLTDIVFTVFTDVYLTNDTYTFNTYPKPDLNAGIITLDEFSIIVSKSEDILITGTGGIV